MLRFIDEVNPANTKKLWFVANVLNTFSGSISSFCGMKYYAIRCRYVPRPYIRNVLVKFDIYVCSTFSERCRLPVFSTFNYTYCGRSHEVYPNTNNQPTSWFYSGNLIDEIFLIQDMRWDGRSTWWKCKKFPDDGWIKIILDDILVMVHSNKQ